MQPNYPQPIGFTGKKVIQEQISFKMVGPDAETKQRFVAILNRRGLGMKEVLIEFIERFVEHDGNLGVIPMSSDSIATEIFALLSSSAGSELGPSEGNIGDRWQDDIDEIKKYASQGLLELVDKTLRKFAEIARQGKDSGK